MKTLLRCLLCPNFLCKKFWATKAGGIGVAISNVRASGSYVRGTNGYSNGLVPMLRNFNETARYVDQGGGKRKGSFAMYLRHSSHKFFQQSAFFFWWLQLGGQKMDESNLEILWFFFCFVLRLFFARCFSVHSSFFKSQILLVAWTTRYLEPWHADIYDFIELRKNHGKEEQRARDLFLGLWIPDLFMKRVKENKEPTDQPGDLGDAMNYFFLHQPVPQITYIVLVW